MKNKVDPIDEMTKAAHSLWALSAVNDAPSGIAIQARKIAEAIDRLTKDGCQVGYAIFSDEINKIVVALEKQGYDCKTAGKALAHAKRVQDQEIDSIPASTPGSSH